MVGILLEQSLLISRFVSSTLHDLFFFIPRIEMCLSADFGAESVGLTDSKDWAHVQGFMPLLAGYTSLGIILLFHNNFNCWKSKIQHLGR